MVYVWSAMLPGSHVGDEQVQEAAAASESFLQMPDAFINMGSLFLALDKPKLAIQVHPPF